MSRFTGKKANVVLAANNPEIHKLFAGKTLDEVGFINKLEDGDITFVWGTNPTDGSEIPNLAITMNGTKYLVPLSNGFPIERRTDAEWLLSCEFRAGFLAVREANGARKTKMVNGKKVPVLADGKDGTDLRPYMSFGKPAGLTIDREEDAFAPMTAEELAKAKAAMSTKVEETA